MGSFTRADVTDLLRSAQGTAERGRVAVLITGPAGIGKTTLTRAAFDHQPRALMGMGKSEQFGGVQPYRPLVQAIDEALRHWLSWATPAALEAMRIRLLPFEDVLRATFPRLQHCWDSPVSAPAADGLRSRLAYALRALVRVLLEQGPTLVLVLDDLQWLDDETLRRVEMGLSDPELKGLLAVFCCRDEGPALTRAAQMLKRVESSGVIILSAAIEPLTYDELCQAAQARLPLEESTLRLLWERSAGSPLYLQHALDYLALGGSLHEPSPARANGVGDILALLSYQLAEFSSAQREVLALLAGSGRRLPLSLLTAACTSLLSPSQLSDFLRHCSDAGLIRLLPGPPPQVELTHDRVQEACLGNPASWPARQLTLFEAALVHLGDLEALDDERLFWILDRQLACTSLLLEHPQRRAALELALLASRRARQRGAHSIAVSASSLAYRLLSPESEHELRVAVLVEYAEASWLSGDLTHFRLLSAEAESVATPLQFASLTELRLQAALAEGQSGLTVELALQAAGHLLPSLSELQADARDTLSLTQIPQLLNRLRYLKPCQDKVWIAVGRILSTANAAAYVGAPQRLAGLVELQIHLAMKGGAPPSFPLTLAFWGSLLASSPSSLEMAQEVGKLALSLSQRNSDGLIQARTADLVYGMVLCWQQDLRHCIEPLQQNRTLAVRHGTFEYAGYSLLKSLAYRLFTGGSLVELARDLQVGRSEMLMLGQVRIARYLERDAAVVGQLLSPGPHPSRLSEAQFDGTALLAELHQSGDRYGLFYTAIARLLLAVVFEEHEAARALSEEAESLRDGGPGLAHQGMLSWLAGLALLGGAHPPSPTALETAWQKLDHLQLLSELAPDTWKARALLLRAELARCQDNHGEAIESYEQAAAESIRCGLVLDEILIYQRRAAFDEELSWVWREKSQRAFQRWRSPATLPGDPSVQLLEAASRVAQATSWVALGSALVDLLRTSFPSAGIVVVGPQRQKLATWNLIGEAEIPWDLSRVQLHPLSSGGLQLTQPIQREGQQVGAIWVGLPEDQPEQHANWISLLESSACLAASAIAELAKPNRPEEPPEELFLTLLQQASAAIFVRDAEGRFLLANQAYAQALHLSVHQLVGRLASEVLPAEFWLPQSEADTRVLASGQAEEVLEDWPHGRKYLTQRVPLRDRWGKIFGLAGWSSEITRWLA